MLPRKRCPLVVESLEDRLTPSYDLFYNPNSNTWTVNQVGTGNATIGVTASSQLFVADANGSATVGVTTGNLNVTMLSNTGDVTLDLDASVGGGLSVDMRHGARRLLMTGATGGNKVTGDVRIRAGHGNQRVDLAVNSRFTTGGRANIDLGLGSDTVTSENGLTVGQNLVMQGVNNYNDPNAAPTVVGGNLTFITNQETEQSSLFLDDSPQIKGSITYIGGTGEDDFVLEDAEVGGNVTVILGNSVDLNNPTVQPEQTVLISGRATPGTTIGGNLTVTGGTGPDRVILDSPGNVIGGNVNVSLGQGPNQAQFEGVLGGDVVTYTGGTGPDSVLYNFSGKHARAHARMGAGNDTFTLQPRARLRSLFIDFGAGTDQFQNQLGNFSFPAVLLNLP